MVVDGGRGGQADRVRDLPDARREAVLGPVGAHEGEAVPRDTLRGVECDDGQRSELAGERLAGLLDAHRFERGGACGDLRLGGGEAVDRGAVKAQIEGIGMAAPMDGRPAVWIVPPLRESALASGYQVYDIPAVIEEHLSRVIAQHAAELLGREEVQQLLHRAAATGQAQDIVPALLPLGVVQKVLQNLLEEQVSIRDLKTIFDVLADQSATSQDADQLTSAVRVALARSIVQDIFGDAHELRVTVLDADLEHTLEQGLHGMPPVLAVEPALAGELVAKLRSTLDPLQAAAQLPVLLVGTRLRLPLARFLRRALLDVRVLSHAEIPESRTIKISYVVDAVGDEG